MSFRIENKLFIRKENLIEFLTYLKDNGASRLYKSRIIESLYFENFNNEIFNDSIEGILPRKKIRIRYYPEEKLENIYLEKKISSVEGRYKVRKVINHQEFKKYKVEGYFDDQYGLSQPLLVVNYLRDYLRIKDIRITIDKNINYKQFRKDLILKESDTIVEIKTSTNKDLEELMSIFPFQNVRFSKYCNGFINLFN